MDLLKKIALAASLFAFAGAANAATYDLNGGDALELDTDYNQQFEIDDIITFLLDEDVILNAGAVLLDFGGAVDGFNMNLVNTTTGTTYDSIESTGFPFDISSLEEDSTGLAGKYEATFSVDSGSSSYYNFSVNVSAVPEPSTYALMLAGLGLVGFMARRRKAA